MGTKVWVRTTGPGNRRHTQVIEADSIDEALRQAVAADPTLHVDEWQEVIEGRIEQRVYTTQLRVGDIVLPSRVRVLERPESAAEVVDGHRDGKVGLVTTGDHGSPEPTPRRWKTSTRLLIERPVQ